MEAMEKFPYEAPAEVYSSGGVGTRKHPVRYRRFPSSAEAIRFTVEELPPIMQRGTVMEVGDDRYEFADIRALYDSEQYPLQRNAEDAEATEADTSSSDRDA